MKILITGGAGFIGSNLVWHLSATGKYEISVIDNLSAGLKEICLPEGVKFHHGDFTDKQMIIKALRGQEAVVHLAALPGVIDSINNPIPSFRVNVEGSFQLLECARSEGVKRFVNASTGGAILGDVAPPISEVMAPSPLSPYGATKLAVEGYCSAYSGSFGLSCVSLRFSNIYGPFSPHKKSVVASFIKNVLSGKPLTIYGDGLQERDYLYVGDLVHGIEAAIWSKDTGAFQLGTGKPTSLLTLVETLKTQIRKNVEIIFEPARRGEVLRTWCDISKASEAFGFHPTTDLTTGLKKTMEWFNSNKNFALSHIAVSSSD